MVLNSKHFLKPICSSFIDFFGVKERFTSETPVAYFSTGEELRESLVLISKEMGRRDTLLVGTLPQRFYSPWRTSIWLMPLQSVGHCNATRKESIFSHPETILPIVGWRL